MENLSQNILEKMNFYLNLLNKLVKKEHENNSIGIILCRERDKIVAKMSLENVSNPIAISRFKLKLDKSIKSLEKLK